jgi:hypothetical protein
MLGKPNGSLSVCVDTKAVHDADGDGIHDCLIWLVQHQRDGGQSKFGILPTRSSTRTGSVDWSMDVNDDFRIAQFVVVQTQ